MSKEDDERTAARDFVMARLAAARGAIAAAANDLDNALQLFVTPDADEKGAERGEALEAIDEALGEAACAIHAAQSEWENVDPSEGEPEVDDGDEEEDEEPEDKDSKPRRRRR